MQTQVNQSNLTLHTSCKRGLIALAHLGGEGSDHLHTNSSLPPLITFPISAQVAYTILHISYFLCYFVDTYSIIYYKSSISIYGEGEKTLPFRG